MIQRVLVLGGNGYIGGRIVATLAADARVSVVAAGRRSPPGRPDHIAVDATDGEALGEALRDFDAVVNCVSGRPTALMANSHALVDAARRQRHAPLVVHLSSMAVYGTARGLVDEETPAPRPLTGYGAAKQYAEAVLAGYPRRVVLRPGCVYGAGSPQWSERIARLLEERRIGDLGAAGDGICNLVHVDDVAAAVALVLLGPQAEGQCYNLAMSDPPTWNEYFERFARALGAVPLRRISQRRLRLESRVLAPVLKGAELLARAATGTAAGVPPPIPPSLLTLWQQEIRLDVRRAQTELGLAWTPLDQGLRESVAWTRRGRHGVGQGAARVR